jgi:hypothetical protein
MNVLIVPPFTPEGRFRLLTSGGSEFRDGQGAAHDMNGRVASIQSFESAARTRFPPAILDRAMDRICGEAGASRE